jgi:hypothetical protein
MVKRHGLRPRPGQCSSPAHRHGIVVLEELHTGRLHCGKVVTVVLEDTRFRVLFEDKELSVHPRTLIKEVNRLRASGHIDYRI